MKTKRIQDLIGKIITFLPTLPKLCKMVHIYPH